MPASLLSNRPTRPLSVEFWSLDRLVPPAKNPRIHSEAQLQQITASIEEFGFTSPILADSNNVIIAGWGRYLGAQRLCLEQVPVIVLGDLTENQKRAYRIADNRIALSAGWDEELLRSELRDLSEADFDLTLIGFAQDELADLLAKFEPLTEDDAAPEPRANAISTKGDIWLMDLHRASVGDATDPNCVSRLMGGEFAQLIFTDPPYNVNYEGHTGDHMRIANDDLSDEEFYQFLVNSFRAYRLIVKPEASLYMCHPSSAQREFQNALEETGFKIRSQIIWVKGTFAWSRSRYKFEHEPVYYAHVAGQTDAWFGNRSQSTVWHVDKPAANRLHPTMKPVELIERAILNSSKRSDLVVDLFGGSGSTLIAAEKRHRRAYLMELDPRYADVIVERWQKYTGRDATLENDGSTFKEIACKRALLQGITKEAL